MIAGESGYDVIAGLEGSDRLFGGPDQDHIVSDRLDGNDLKAFVNIVSLTFCNQDYPKLRIVQSKSNSVKEIKFNMRVSG